MNNATEPSAEELRAYEQLVADCLQSSTEKMRVVRVVSATERGTTLQLESATASFAFKFVQASAEPSVKIDFLYLRAVIENEAAMLTQLQEHTRHLLVAHGTSAERAWVMTRWLSGSSVARLARQLRQKRQEQSGDEALETRRYLLALITEVFHTVASLHEQGYTHGDIQPAHLIYDEHTNDGTPILSLVDFGLAQQQGHPGIPYRGALVHFVAPEVAAGMRDGSKEISYDTLSEIYSVASVAFQLYTGYPSTDYGKDDNHRPSFLEMLSRIADGDRSTRRTFASTEPPRFPELESILEQCLSTNREERPSLKQAHEALQQARKDH